MSNSLIEDLNPEQRRAVEHGEGPLLIFAGAGSGKTRVLTRRIAHLITTHQVRPSEILAVTFTNKAAGEMKKRVFDILGSNAAPVWVSTFHSSCCRILRSNAKYLDFSPQFAIYDSSDARAVLKRVYKRLNVDPKIIDPRMVASKIDRAKNQYKFPESFLDDPYIPSPLREPLAEIYEEYQKELQRSNAMDFGDLLTHTLTLFRLEPDILERYQEKFRHILIDEYQDTNHVQYLLVSLLAKRYRNICVVGDDDQSIYSFRGATIKNILTFREDYPDTEVVTLDTNYRSTKSILDAANAVIARNSSRQKKQMRTPNPAGGKLIACKGLDEEDEAAFVIQELHGLRQRGVNLNEVAIFYRTNAQSRAIEESLCEHEIPYEIYGSLKFYERKEIKDILAYLRLVNNPQDSESFFRIVNTPPRGLGPTSIAALIEYCKSQNLPPYDALLKGLQESAPFLTKTNKKRFADFTTLIEQLKAEAVETREHLQVSDAFDANRMNALSTLIRNIAQKSGYLDKLKAEDSLESQSRIENIHELIGVAAQYTNRAIENSEEPSIESFLDRASLTSDADGENIKTSGSSSKGSVSLMTLHLAKGLEFDYVFFVGLEEGILPHVRSLDDRTSLEEERRLCYVGITRARKQLYVTRTSFRKSFGQSNWYTGLPSRFLKDIPPHLVEDRRGDFF